MLKRRTRVAPVIFLCLAFALLLLLSACSLNVVRGPTKVVPYTTITLTTEDNVSIAASYYDSSSNKGLLFVHMLGRDRHTFDEYAEILYTDYKIVSLDLRGHGESEGDYVLFTDEDFNNMIYDVEAAAAYLESKGVAESNISVVGASIGANIAVKYAEAHPTDKLVIISPGLRLRGIDLSRTSYNGDMLVLVGNYDAYSSISVDDFESLWPNARFMRYDASGHGTDLLKNGGLSTNEKYDLSAREDFLFYMT